MDKNAQVIVILYYMMPEFLYCMILSMKRTENKYIKCFVCIHIFAWTFIFSYTNELLEFLYLTNEAD